MAWFKKKQSPLDRRLDELNQQISELENQLRKQREDERRRASSPTPPSASAGKSDGATASGTRSNKPSAQPRFRTTVTPKGVSPVHGIEPHEVDFFARKDRTVDFGLEGHPAAAKPAEEKQDEPPSGESKIKRFLADWIELFGKPKPPSKQERLASYLTTGSFQRLKPLRYEKRVARNRFIILFLIVGVILFLLVKCVTR